MTRFLAALALAFMAALASPAMAATHDLTPTHPLFPVMMAGSFLLLVGATLTMARMVQRFALVIVTVGCVMVVGTQAFAADSDGTRPDPVLTPGEIRTTDRHEICGHSTREFRNVSVTTKVAARRAYGITSAHGGWCGRAGCEIDHLIPLTVGGGNSPGSIRNLWPQRKDGPWGFPVKDRCEAAVGRAICAGKITVEAAQAIFRDDWTVGCAPYLVRAGSR